MDTVDRIFKLLKQQALSQQDFANAIGVKKNAVSKWKSRDSESYRWYLDKIANVLGTTVQWLMYGEELPPKSETPTPASGDAQAVARAYEQADEKSRALVRLALGLE